MSDLIDRQALLEKKIRIPIARIVTEDKIIYRDVVFVKDIEAFPSAEQDNRLTEIASLVQGTIDHFNLEDAMDLLYQIKEVLKDE